MDALSAALGEMLKAYPDPNGVRPIANYPATMYGVTIVFHVRCSYYLRIIKVRTSTDKHSS